ncbi:hypothetical protein [Hymenobacter cavernae]|uniref:Uncharacterized protein n=1 Tax=Hymenobacter cavernae TaxID=2044852 RepID=A0ABQ1U124_9BACT|nr:hypothetical protein [Hymenobacter cavernae]GGF06512.1 hypothetical protein GCM10011383_16990 [Hymenobacter cavernae]
MDYTTDLSALKWLRGSVSDRSDIESLKVKHLLPNTYSAYIALLPSVGIIDGFPFNEVDPNTISIEQINANVKVWNEYGIYSFNSTPNYSKTRFSKLAKMFELPYDLSMQRTLPWRKRGFAILEQDTLDNLRGILKQIFLTNKVNLYIEDYWRWYEVYNLLPHSKEVIYRANIDEFIHFFSTSFFDASLYLLPDDRSWCLMNIENGFCPVIGIGSCVNNKWIIPSDTEILNLKLEDPI